MKKIKKVWLSVFAFLMVLTCPLILTGCGKKPEEPADSTWENFTIDGTTLTKYEGNKTKVEIPNTVTVIENDVFVGNELIEEVIIPDSVTEIGWEAFRWCSNLKKVHIGSGLDIDDIITEPNESARFPATFGCCYNLESFTVSENSDAFKTSNSGKSLLTKDGKTLVAGTKYIEMPEGIEIIGQSAFFGQYYGLENNLDFAIPETVQEIQPYAFYHVANGLINDGANINFAAEKAIDLVVPASVEALGTAAFRGMNIKSVDFNSVIDFSDMLFYECVNLKNVEFLEGVEKIGSRVFQGCSLEFNDNIFTLPASVVEIGEYGLYNAFGSKYNSNIEGFESLKLQLSEGLKIIGRYAFNTKEENKTSFSEIVVPKTVEYIGGYTYGWSVVNKFTFAGDIGDWAKIDFGHQSANPIYVKNNNGSVRSIVLTDPVNGEYSFDKDSSVIIPEGVEKIGSFAFPHMVIPNLTLPTTLTEIGERAFTGSKFIAEQLIIPASVTIKPYAFAYANMNIIIPANLTKIEDFAFYGYGNTLYLVDSEASQTWGENWNAKNDTTDIKVSYNFDLEWLGVVKANPQFTFNGYKITAFDKTTLKGDGTDEIIIPEGTVEIGGSVFAGVKTIYRLVLPASLKIVGASAFTEGAPNSSFFINIEFNGTVNDWAQIQFTGVYSNPMVRQNAYTGAETKTFKFKDFDSTKDSTLSIGLTGEEFAINEYAFAYFKFAANVVLGEKVTEIAKGGLEGVAGNITVSSKVKTIGTSVFAWSYSTITIDMTETEFEANVTKDENWNKNFKGTIKYKQAE